MRVGFWFFLLSLPAAMVSFAEEPVVREVSPGFYVGEGLSPDGEKIYFGMEKITPANEDGISDFSLYTGRFFNRTRGMITVPLYLCANGKKEYTFDDYKSVSELLGFEKPAYEEFYKKLCDKSVNLKVRFERLVDIPTGPLYMFQSLGDYVAYVSKRPVTSPVAWKTRTVKDYLATTKDLILTVGVSLDVKGDPTAFTNRGIARTYYAILDGGYKNVSLHLHGFTAAVAGKFFDKKNFLVQAAPLMAEIIEKNLKPNEYKIVEAFQPSDKGFVIPVENLIDIYTGKRKLR